MYTTMETLWKSFCNLILYFVLLSNKIWNMDTKECFLFQDYKLMCNM